MKYSINDVSKMFGLSIYTIRFYDKEGLFPFITRGKSGNREFTEEDLNLVKLVCCLKNSGMKIKKIKHFMDLCMEGDETIEIRKNLLIEHRKTVLEQIDDLNKNLNLINFKIDFYESPNSVQNLSVNSNNLLIYK